MTATAHSQLSDMRACAYRLGMAFGAEAERAETHRRRMEFFQLFDRCFFAVRVSIALELRLRREAGARPMTERETERADPPEREAPERDGSERYDERDRERDVEPVSLPILLRTLTDIAADAQALPGPPPAALPTLRELLAQATSEPAARARGTPLRARLNGSATALTLAPPVRPIPRRASPIRRATGPP